MGTEESCGRGEPQRTQGAGKRAQLTASMGLRSTRATARQREVSEGGTSNVSEPESLRKTHLTSRPAQRRTRRLGDSILGARRGFHEFPLQSSPGARRNNCAVQVWRCKWGVGILIQLLQTTVRGRPLFSGPAGIRAGNCNAKFALRPDSSVVERGPEKAGVGGSIPSLATTPEFPIHFPAARAFARKRIG